MSVLFVFLFDAKNDYVLFSSKVLEFIREAGMPLTEQVFAALITAYGFNG